MLSLPRLRWRHASEKTSPKNGCASRAGNLLSLMGGFHIDVVASTGCRRHQLEVAVLMGKL